MNAAKVYIGSILAGTLIAVGIKNQELHVVLLGLVFLAWLEMRVYQTKRKKKDGYQAANENQNSP